jgi:hypothetical protein
LLLLLLAALPEAAQAQAIDAPTFYVRVFLDGRWQAEGATVQALIDGRDCTGRSYSVRPPSDGPDTPPRYSVWVFTAAERDGCGRTGSSISWLVNDRPASTTTAWPVFEPRRPHAQYSLDVFVGPQPMALQGDVYRASGLPPDPAVDAYIEGKLCATGVFQPASWQLGGGDSYWALVVPPAEIEPGCGRPNVPVDIRIGGRSAEGSTVWRPGSHDHFVVLQPESAAPIAVIGTDSNGWRWFAPGFGLATLLGVLVTSAVILALRQRASGA